MKYSIAYTHTGFAIVEAENEADAAERFNRMNLTEIDEVSDGDTIFINSIYEDEDEESSPCSSLDRLLHRAKTFQFLLDSARSMCYTVYTVKGTRVNL